MMLYSVQKIAFNAFHSIELIIFVNYTCTLSISCFKSGLTLKGLQDKNEV